MHCLSILQNGSNGVQMPSTIWRSHTVLIHCPNTDSDFRFRCSWLLERALHWYSYSALSSSRGGSTIKSLDHPLIGQQIYLSHHSSQKSTRRFTLDSIVFGLLSKTPKNGRSIYLAKACPTAIATACHTAIATACPSNRQRQEPRTATQQNTVPSTCLDPRANPNGSCRPLFWTTFVIFQASVLLITCPAHHLQKPVTCNSLSLETRTSFLVHVSYLGQRSYSGQGYTDIRLPIVRLWTDKIRLY